MTEINSSKDALSKISTPSKSREAKTESSAFPSDFSRIFSAELEGMTPDSPPISEGSGELPELSATFAASRISQTGAESSGAVAKAAAILDRLDTYARDLADPDVSLRGAHNLLEQIDGDVQDLLSTSQEEKGAGLREIIDHMAALVAVERIKLDRGDYL